MSEKKDENRGKMNERVGTVRPHLLQQKTKGAQTQLCTMQHCIMLHCWEIMESRED